MPTAGYKTLHATCHTHRGPRGYANLAVSMTPSADLRLDPHVTGGCVLELDAENAERLRNLLTVWLGKP